MRNKTRCYSILLTGLALLLVSSFIGCGQSQSEAYKEGYEAGLAQSEAETTPVPSTAPDKQTSSPAPEQNSTPTTPPSLAHFVLGDLTITPMTVSAGEVVTISIAVSNTGGIEGSYTGLCAVKKVGDTTFDFTTLKNVEVTLNPGQTKTVTFTTSKTKSGTYTVGINGKVVGQFTVTEPQPTPIQPEQAQVISDLAYIKISAGGYADDADPESDGISLHITFYDSKSEGIIFQGIPVTVTIKLYGYEYINMAGFSFPDREKRELVHQEQITIDHSIGGLVTSKQLYEWEQEHNTTLDLSSTEIKIPFENMMVDQNKYYSLGNMEVTVTTPKQGSFQAMQDLVRLYPED